MNNKVSIQIVTWNRCEEVMHCLATVYKFAPNYEVVLVDNASTDNTIETVQQAFPQVKIIKMHKNLGCPGARNIGVANCSSDYVYFLDDDGWITEETLPTLITTLDEDSSIAVAMSVIHEIDQSGELVRKIPEEIVGTKQIQTFTGCCSLIRRELYNTYGGFPDDFFRQGEEEFLSLRLFNAGYKIVSVENSIMYHKPSPINRDSNMFYYYQLRNASKTAARLYPFPYNKYRILFNLFRTLKVRKVDEQEGLIKLHIELLLSRQASQSVSCSALLKFKELI
jgi:GT2 family glycosyltransferase